MDEKQTQPTLSREAMGKAILKAPRVSVEAMDAEAFFKWSRPARVTWYRSTLGAYEDRLFESAHRNKVPAQLIAACVLNELADIKFQDVWQERLGAIKGSLGPAQMQVMTAVEYGHVDVPREIRERNDEANRLQPVPASPYGGYSPPPPKDLLLRAYVAERLRIMQVGIEAAARELARLLTLMTKHKAKSWQQQHSFNAPAPAVASHPDVFFQKNNIRGGADSERFEQLCDSAIAAYNSPDIIITMNPGKSVLVAGASGAPPYLDARQHGFNGATIGGELFQAGLFVQQP